MTEKLTKEKFIQDVFDYENEKEWKYKGEKPAIIDFYADWCGPCKVLEPVMKEIADEYSDQLTVYKVDTEQEQELAGIFGIRSIPSVLFIPTEGKPQMSVGALPKQSMQKAIKDVLGVNHQKN